MNPIDVHAHIFPPEFAARRSHLVEIEPAFAEMYANPKARLASADDLMASMDASGVAVTVVQGFSWRDPGLCREHNDYLIQAAASSDGRIVAFGTLPLAAPDGVAAEAERLAHAGAAGFGELRPDSCGFDLDSCGDELAEIAEGLDRPMLFHVSEPVGHSYPGKRGLSLAAFYRFVAAHPGCRIVGAHWGGGLPFYGLMPEVASLQNVWYDTAAGPLLYDDRVFSVVTAIVGASRVLFGSDYPLLDQREQLGRVRALGLAEGDEGAFLWRNAAQLLEITAPV